jgi:glyoxylase I family protein
VKTLHHIGVPIKDKRPDMMNFEPIKCWGTDPDTTPGRVEYLYFEPGSPITEPVLSVPHLAYRVDDFHKEIQGKELVVGPIEVVPGLWIGFFWENGILVEYHQVPG